MKRQISAKSNTFKKGIFVKRGTTDFGPYSNEQVQAMVADGILFAADLACREGMHEWNPLYTLIALPSQTGTLSATPTQPTQNGPHRRAQDTSSRVLWFRIIGGAALVFVIGAIYYQSVHADASNTLGVSVFLILFGMVYFIPAIAGCKKRNAGAIFVLNLFLGWTLVGWVVAFVWACTKEEG